jgi:hypothetical protein
VSSQKSSERDKLWAADCCIGLLEANVTFLTPAVQFSNDSARGETEKTRGRNKEQRFDQTRNKSSRLNT